MTDERDKPETLSVDEVLREDGPDGLFPAEKAADDQPAATPDQEATETVRGRRVGLWILAALVVVMLAYLTLQ